jgi:hypothetical protein
MAEWKKVIVSGSVAELSASLYRGAGQSPQQVTNLASTTILSGSFSGSFHGTFNGANIGNTLEATTYDNNWGGGYFQTGSVGDNIWEIGVTTYSTAIDDINELLGSLVSVSDVQPLTAGTVAHTAGGSPVTATSKNLSFGTDGALSDADNNNYYPVKRNTDASTFAAGGANITLNGTYTAAGSGDITTSATKSGTIYHLASNHSVAFTLKGTAGSFTNGTQTGNNPTRYFHEGVLEVYINNASAPAISVSLSGSDGAISTTSNNVTVVAGAVGNVYQSILGQAQSTQASGNTHKYRAGVSVTVANGAFRDGWNWIAIVHNTAPGDAAGSDRTLNLYEFIKHSDSSTLTNNGTSLVTNGSNAYNNFAITQGDGLYHYLSGVKYYTSTATVTPLTSSLSVSNSYRMVHPSVSITQGVGIATGEKYIASGSKTSATVTTINATANSNPNATTPNLDANAATPYDSTLKLDLYETFDLGDFSNFFGYKDDNDILGSTFTVANSFKSPSSVTSGQFTTGSFYFKKGTASGNTSLKEYFNDEARRLPSNVDLTSAGVIAALKTTSAINTTYAWDSEGDLSTDVGYSDGLLCQPNSLTGGNGLTLGRLLHPTKGALNSDGNFTSVNLGPASNVNYSTATGVKYFYRNFYLNSSNTPTGIGLTAKGSARLVFSDATPTGNQIKIDFKVPGYYTSEGWISFFDDANLSLTGGGTLTRFVPNLSSPAVLTNQYIDIDSSGLNFSSGGNSHKILLNRWDGGASITAANTNTLSVVVRITVPSGWTGYLDYLSVSLVTSDVSSISTNSADITWS